MKILIVRSGEGDWEALYVDGKKRYENHSIPLDIILDVLGIKIDYFDHPELEDADEADPHKMFPPVWKK